MVSGSNTSLTEMSLRNTCLSVSPRMQAPLILRPRSGAVNGF